MTKKLVIITLFVFWAIVVAVLTAGLIFYDNNNQASPLASGIDSAQGLVSQNSNNNNNINGSSIGDKIILNTAEVSKHNSSNDCWIIINNKIYNVTSYLNQHPGLADTITPYCGKQATQAFQTKDVGRPHSSYAASLLNNYLVGDLNQAVTSNELTNKTQSTNSNPVTQVSTSPNTVTPTNSPVSPKVTLPNTSLILNTQEIAKHNNSRSCWLIINNKVYDVTTYLSRHPGSASTITPYCGKEATRAFQTKNIGQPHSSYANSLLASYYIGNLNQTTTNQNLNQTIKNNQNNTPATNPSREVDEEDD